MHRMEELRPIRADRDSQLELSRGLTAGAEQRGMKEIIHKAYFPQTQYVPHFPSFFLKGPLRLQSTVP